MSYRKLSLIALFVTGCGTAVATTVINPSPRRMTSRPPETVEIFSSGPPRRPYVDVAFLEAEQETSMSSDHTAEFIIHLRLRAAEMGCDGLVLGGVTHSADVVTSVLADVNSSKKGITATCIVYLPPAVAARRSTMPPPPAAPPPAAPPGGPTSAAP